MKKNILFIGISIICIVIPSIVYAESTVDTEEILKEQESKFGIREFIKDSQKYMPDFMDDMDINNILDMALKGKIENKTFIKKILNLLGVQVKDTLKILISVLIIILIHSILRSVTDGLENSDVSKIVYYVQYILIVTITMANFSEILTSVNETIQNLVGFSEILMPLLITLMIYTGSIATTTMVEPIILFIIEFIANLITKLILPVISMICVLIIVSKITDKVKIEKLTNFMKSTIVWTLGVVLTVFIGVISLEGTLTSSVDGITAKTAKAAVSNLIPVVRKNSRRWGR